MKIAWTGPQPRYMAQPRRVKRQVASCAADLQAEFGGAVEFLIGGQRGVDLWAGEAARRLGVLYQVVLPILPGLFTAGWTKYQRRLLRLLIARTSALTIVDPEGRMGEEAYRRRNSRLAESCDMLVAFWTGLELGGTHETMLFARSLGKPVRLTRIKPSASPVEVQLRGL